MKPAQYWIEKLKLAAHPEGGAFRETYRSSLVIDKNALPQSFGDDRNAATSIYFLLQSGQISAFHRIKSDEGWHFYEGHSLSVYEIDGNGTLMEHRLGSDIEGGETFQCVIRAGNWFASRVNAPHAYALAGCTVSPGFDFNDFEMAHRDELILQYPQHTDLIKELTY